MDKKKELEKNKIEIKKILPIKSVEQLVTSYFLSQILIELKENIEKSTEEIGIKNLFPLDIPDSNPHKNTLENCYKRIAKDVKFKPEFVFSAKFGFESMIKYNFSSDPSVFTYAQNDTTHLRKAFGNDGFATLAKVNLFDHTLNVLKKALAIYEAIERKIGLDVIIIAALYHDFGKSKAIREKLLGITAANNKRIYKAHADVSEMFIKEVLAPELEQKFEKVPEVKERIPSFIDKVAFLVKNHHPSNAKLKNDPILKFVIQSDQKAREEEYRNVIKKQKEEINE
jgi:hypothetical protein